MIIFNKLGSLGRLGNQLFTIAATIAHGARMNVPAKFNKWEYSYFFENPIDDSLDSEFTDYYDGIKYELLNWPQCHHIPLPRKDNLILLGFFQSEKYFKTYSNLIQHHFKPKYQYIKSFYELPQDHYLKQPNITAIHVRRTDYLEKQAFHPVQPISYYEKAMEHIKNIHPDAKFVFHSDDLKWCRETFGNEHFYSNIESDILDLYAGAFARHHVLANSSFSYWMSWLNKLFYTDSADYQIVIAPEKWYGEAAENHDTSDLYLDNWIKM